MDELILKKDAEKKLRKFASKKVAENYCRRWATRLGYSLEKSHAKLWSINDHQEYRIVDLNNTIKAGQKFDLTLEKVFLFLMEAQHDQNH
jgi:hypothetical protein